MMICEFPKLEHFYSAYTIFNCTQYLRDQVLSFIFFEFQYK